MSTTISKTPRGALFIISGPSGSGKSTVISRLLQNSNLRLHLSVSVTTRPPREGERDGVHYYFWPSERFEKERAAGRFLEWAQVHGHSYGTLKDEVEPYRAQGVGVILDIDVQGRQQVCRQVPEAVSIFLRTSRPDIYEERLRKRGTESEESIQRRLQTAQVELAKAKSYDFQVCNDDLERAVAELGTIVQSHYIEVEHA
jgi:guanylate kinase